MFKTSRFVVALSLMLSLAAQASAGASPGSFSHGFSSHASSSPRSSSSSSSSASRSSSAPKSSGFGTFSRQSAAPAPRAPAPSNGAGKSGGFGSFGGSATPRQSDSALSQQLGRDAAQANALRTLDQRRGSQAANQPSMANQVGNGASGQAANGMPMPQQPPTTVIVNQDRGNGLGTVVAGAMIANSMNAHARGGYYPPTNSGGDVVRHGGTVGNSSGGSFFGLFLSLCVLAAIAWTVYFIWKRVRAARAAAAAADKPNYSFERN